jgi:ABC transport system ATP-binding/permease protein
MWKLVIEDDEGKRMVVHLSRDEYTIGRKEGHAIRLTQRNVSRTHATLRRGTNGSANTYQLTDAESYNGVFVNGVRLVGSQDMVHGDLIQVGDYRVLIQNEATEAETDPAEPAAPVSATPTALTQQPSEEDLKSTISPGKVRMTGALLLQRPNRLVVIVGPNPGAEFSLDKDRVVIGRAEDADVSINHNSVSRTHCEVHKLSEGRYEIVDRESQNGVRVNARDAVRGIIEAGDVIELGDVKLKFVAAGDVFVPNSTESQQLQAITDRAADAPIPQRRQKGSIVSFILLGLLVGGIALGIVYMLTRQPEPDPLKGVAGSTSQTATSGKTSAPSFETTGLTAAPPGSDTASGSTTAAPLDPAAEAILGPARRFAEQQKWNELEAKLQSAPQAVRKLEEFEKLATMWSAAEFQKADEASGAERRAILRKIEKATFVDADTRKRATEALAAPAATTAGALPGSASGGTTAPAGNGNSSTPDKTPSDKPSSNPPPNKTATPVEKPTGDKPVKANVDDTIAALYQAHKYAECAALAAKTKTPYAKSMADICNKAK